MLFWFAAGLIATSSAVAEERPAPAPISSEYKLLFADEFSGDRVGDTWDFRVGERTGVGINGTNRKENVSVQDGNLVIKLETTEVDGKVSHLGGGLISKGIFGYGYYETRSKPAMAGSGVHSAFWQRGLSNGDYRNSIFEIDGYEIDSPHTISTNNLYVGPNSFGRSEQPWPLRSNIPVKLDREGWFIDAFDYSPTGIKFYDNGKLVATARYPRDFQDLVAQQNVWLTALNGVGRVSAGRQPDYTYFDYFRFYARTYPGYNILPNGNFEYNRLGKDPQTPMAWMESGDVSSSFIVARSDKPGQFHLRHGGSKPFKVSSQQKLQYINDGKYNLSFWYRTSGQTGDSSVVFRSGDIEYKYHLRASTKWRYVKIDNLSVLYNEASIAVSTDGVAGATVDVDDINFYAAGQSLQPATPLPRDPARDAIWEAFLQEPARFTGDESFYFFDRNVGFGDTVTLKATLKADELLNAIPIMRAPKDGKDGWALGLTATGGAYCQLGSLGDHVKAEASSVYQPGVTVDLTCLYSRGTVRLMANGQQVSAVSAPGYGALDKSAAGRLGATTAPFDAMGEVTGQSQHAAPQDASIGNFRGDLSNVRIWNRDAL